MTQITINIDNPQDATLIKKILKKFESVTFKVERQKKSSYEQACDDIEAGRITYCDNVEDMFNKLNS